MVNFRKPHPTISVPTKCIKDCRPGTANPDGGRSFFQESSHRRRRDMSLQHTRRRRSAGLLPIIWSTGTGAEIMQRIAVPMIGGMISSTLLTLIVTPAIFGLIKGYGLPAIRSQRRSTSNSSRRENETRANSGTCGVKVPGLRSFAC